MNMEMINELNVKWLHLRGKKALLFSVKTWAIRNEKTRKNKFTSHYVLRHEINSI